MIKTIGIEAKPIILELPDLIEVLFTVAPPIHIQDHLFIYFPGSDADETVKLLREAELLEEIHTLLKIDFGKAGEDFFDYGFFSEEATFLFADQLSAFELSGADKKQMEMALIQIEEHLTFQASGDIFFISKHYNDLIKGIVRAYNIEVIFLDLDK